MFVFLLFGSLLGLLLVLLPALNSHAVERHGPHAERVVNYMVNFDPNDDDDDDVYYKGEQEDGREIHILRLSKVTGKITWAVVITVGGIWFVTAFLTQRPSYVQKLKESTK